MLSCLIGGALYIRDALVRVRGLETIVQREKIMGLQTTIQYTLDGHTYYTAVRSNQGEDEAAIDHQYRHNTEVVAYQIWIESRGATIVDVTVP